MARCSSRFRFLAVLKWTGVALCILLSAAWIASRWAEVWVVRTAGVMRQGIAVERGCLRLASYDEGSEPRPSPDGWIIGSRWRAGWVWLPHRTFETAGTAHGASVEIPLWAPLVVIALPVAWLFHRDRRSGRWLRAGRCAGCGYDLAGLASGEGGAACPECGKAT